MGNEIWCFFDRDQYSLSNLRFKTVKIKGCARNFPWAGDRQRTSGHEGTKTAKHNSVFISNKLRKVILDYVQSEFPEQLQAQDFSKYLFPSRKGADTPLTRQSLWRIIHEAGTAVGLKLVPIRCVRPLAIFIQARNQNRDHSVAAKPFFTTGDLTLYWNHPGRQRYCSKEFGFMTE